MEKLCGSSVKVPAKTFSSAKFSLGKWKSPGAQQPLVELFVLRSYGTRPRWGRGRAMASATPDKVFSQGLQGGDCEREREGGRVYEKSITIPSAIRRRVLIFKEVIELAEAKCRDTSTTTLPHVARLAAAAAASCRQIRAATRNC